MYKEKIVLKSKSSRFPIRQGRTIAEIEKLIKALVKKHNSTVRIAQELGVTPNTIRHWLKQFGYVYDPDQVAWVKRN